LRLRPRLLPDLEFRLRSGLLPDLGLRSRLLPYLGPRLDRLLVHLPRGLRLDLPLARLAATHLRPAAPQTLGLPGSVFLWLSPLLLLLLLLLLWLLLRLWNRGPPRRLCPHRGGRGGWR